MSQGTSETRMPVSVDPPLFVKLTEPVDVDPAAPERSTRLTVGFAVTLPAGGSVDSSRMGTCRFAGTPGLPPDGRLNEVGDCVKKMPFCERLIVVGLPPALVSV